MEETSRIETLGAQRLDSEPQNVTVVPAGRRPHNRNQRPSKTASPASNSTLELAKPASAIRISENNLAGEIGTAMQLPVKVHLENPFLGSECYVGSSSNPLIWNLTTGTTNPPAPNKPITGSTGVAEFLEEGSILALKGAKLVDNKWSAPGATGCGGFLVELILDPIINSASGLPAAAGRNTAILNNTINVASAFAVRLNNAENP